MLVTHRCLLAMKMVSSNHTLTLKIHEESQGLLANSIAWPVGIHTSTSCPSSITFADKHCSSFRYRFDMCNFWRTYDTASKKHARHTTPPMIILHYYCSWTLPLHGKLPGYPIFLDFLEIKRMCTTVYQAFLLAPPPSWNRNAWEWGYCWKGQLTTAIIH